MQSNTIFESLFLDGLRPSATQRKIEQIKENNTLVVQLINRSDQPIDKDLNLRHLIFFEGDPSDLEYQLLQCKLKSFSYIEGKKFLLNHNISELQLSLSSDEDALTADLMQSMVALVGLKRIHLSTPTSRFPARGFWRSVRVNTLYVNGTLIKSVDKETYGAVYEYPPNFTFRHTASTSHVKAIDATLNFDGLMELEAEKCPWLEKLKCCLFVDTPPLDLRTRIYPIIVGCHLRTLDTRGTSSMELFDMLAGHPTLKRWLCGPYVPLDAAKLLNLFKNTPDLSWEVWGSQIDSIPQDWTVRLINIVASVVSREAIATLRALYTHPESSLWVRRGAPLPITRAESLVVRENPFYATIRGPSTLTAISVTRCGIRTFDVTAFPALTDLDLSENPLLEETAASLMGARLTRLAMNQCFTQIDGLLLRAGSKQVFECDSPYRKHFSDRTLQLLLDDSGKLQKLHIRYVREDDEPLEQFSHRIDDLQIHMAPIN